MCLQQSRVYQVGGINDTLGKSPCHLAVFLRIYYLLRVILTLLPAVSSNVIDETDIRKLPVHLVVYAVGNGAAGFAKHYVLLSHPAVSDEGAH